MSRFEIKYSIEDGYVTGDRPQYVALDDGDIDCTDYDETELMMLYQDFITEHFEDYITTNGDNLDEFLAWAKAVMREREKE